MESILLKGRDAPKENDSISDASAGEPKAKKEKLEILADKSQNIDQPQPETKNSKSTSQVKNFSQKNMPDNSYFLRIPR